MKQLKVLTHLWEKIPESNDLTALEWSGGLLDEIYNAEDQTSLSLRKILCYPPFRWTQIDFSPNWMSSDSVCGRFNLSLNKYNSNVRLFNRDTRRTLKPTENFNIDLALSDEDRFRHAVDWANEIIDFMTKEI